MKSPRFFCDNCGTEVSRDQHACPKCGRFFASVRCPACGFSGEEKLFAKGCPSCGYSAPKAAPKARNAKQRGRAKPPKIAAGPLPLWVYVVSAAALLFVLAALVIVLR